MAFVCYFENSKGTSMKLTEIRQYFSDKGISQREVGRFIGVDDRTIRRWFSEEGSWPKLFELAIEADMFDVDHYPLERIKNRLKIRSKTND
jgi:transcriptional regulator with XRE-family HTH domain